MRLFDLITENDGVSLCPARIFGILTIIVMLYKFIVTGVPDYLSLAGGITGIGMMFAGNKLAEGKQNAVT